MAVGNVQDASKNSSERNASRGEVFMKYFIALLGGRVVPHGFRGTYRDHCISKIISVSGGFDTAAIAAYSTTSAYLICILKILCDQIGYIG